MASKNSVVEPCPICIEPYTKAVRKEIKCQYCQESVCSKCVEKYLTNTIDDPHCPHCRRAWSRAVLSTTCTKTFLNGPYFKYRQDILLNREKSYMPQLQEAARREKQARDLEKEDLEFAKEYGRLVCEYNAKLAKISQARGQLYRRISNIRAGRDEMTGARIDGTTEVKEEKAKFVRRCTANDCKGFLSSVWKCGLCNVWVCPDCFEVKGADKDAAHTCKPEMLETAKLIRKDTKPCPACGEMIMKTEGCFAPGTPVRLFDGGIKMSEVVCVGDELVGDDGKKRTVLETRNGVDEMFEVSQCGGGITYTVNSKHKLVLVCGDRGEIVEMAVDEYMELSEQEKRGLMGLKMDDTLVEISVKYVGIGEYFGWSLDGNKRFVLVDNTVVRNCDQMFCTSCHQAFSWNTGKIVTSGPIHNPHYFQWLARGGQPVPQNPGNVPCGGLPDPYYLRRTLAAAKIAGPELERFMKIYRECAHFIDVERHRYERHLQANNNQDIGVKYMMNEMSEDMWKQTLAKREKERQKSNEIRDVLDAFNGAAIDLFRRIDTQRIYTHDELVPILISMMDELEALRVFTMEALRDVSKSFGCSIPMINKEWKTIHGKYTLLFPAKKREAKKDKPANAGAGKAAESDSDDSDSGDE